MSMYSSHDTDYIFNVTICLLARDDFTKVQHDIFVHTMPVLHLLGQDDEI